MTTIPSLDWIEKELTRIHPLPGARFKRRMASAPWTRAGLRSPRLQILLATALAIVLFVVFIFATPQGRAIARELFGLFPTTTQKYYVLSLTETPTARPTYVITTGLATVQPATAANPDECGPTVSPASSTFVCQLMNAEAALGFEIQSFPADRIDLEFDFLLVDPDAHLVNITFKSELAFYSLTQGLGAFPASIEPWGLVPDDAIRQVHVGGHPAEYVSGGFVPIDGSGAITWDPSNPTYRLRWKAGDRWFEISRFLGYPDDRMVENLIGLAEHLVSVSQGAHRLAGAGTPTVEQQAGFDIQEPAVLPEGFHFCGASYIGDIPGSIPNTVVLNYCYEEESRSTGFLNIYQTPLTNERAGFFYEFAASPGNLVTLEDVAIGAGAGKYLVDDDGYTGLIWEHGSNQYLMTFSGRGSRLGKDDLIAIAGSMK